MGIAVELSVLLGIAILNQSIFGVFEVETAPWRTIVKWGLLVGVTLGVSRFVGHWAVLLPILGGVAGVVAHTLWCRRHGIDPLRATPRRKYYELRGWT